MSRLTMNDLIAPPVPAWERDDFEDDLLPMTEAEFYPDLGDKD